MKKPVPWEDILIAVVCGPVFLPLVLIFDVFSVPVLFVEWLRQGRGEKDVGGPGYGQWTYKRCSFWHYWKTEGPWS